MSWVYWDLHLVQDKLPVFRRAEKRCEKSALVAESLMMTIVRHHRWCDQTSILMTVILKKLPKTSCPQRLHLTWMAQRASRDGEQQSQALHQ